MKKLLLPVLTLLSLASVLFLSSTEVVRSEQLVGTHISWQNFAAMPSINDVSIRGNNVWAATENGAIWWDRLNHNYREFTSESGLPHNQLSAVAIDANGGAWFASSGGGINVYRNNVWIHYTLADGLPSLQMNAIVFDSNGIAYAGGDTGLVRFNGSTWQAINGSPHYVIKALAFDLQGNLWVGTLSATYKYDGVTWQSYTNPGTGPFGSMEEITVAPNGDVWFAFTNSGLGRMSGPNWTRYQVADGLLSLKTGGVTIDGNGHIWIGYKDTFNACALSEFNGSSWIHHTGFRGEGDCETQGTTTDNQGHVWFATSKGLHHFNGTNLEMFASSVVDTPVTATTVDDEGNVWVGMGQIGVGKFDGQAWTIYQPFDGLPERSIKAIAQDHDGNMWFAVWESPPASGVGVTRFDGTIWTTFTISNGLVSNWVYDITVDANGNMWFAAHGGVSKFDGTTWTNFTTGNSGLPESNVHKIAAYGNEIWFAYRFEGGGATKLNGNIWTTYTISDGLPSDMVHDITFDATGQPWLATGQGIAHFDGNTWDNHLFNLPTTVAYTIGLDSEEYIWAGTDNSGLARFDGLNWSYYDTSDGLINNTINTSDIGEQGIALWFGTNEGVVRFNVITSENDVMLPFIQ